MSIEEIKERILAEHRKHPDLDWAELAAIKIHKSMQSDIPGLREEITALKKKNTTFSNYINYLGNVFWKIINNPDREQNVKSSRVVFMEISSGKFAPYLQSEEEMIKFVEWVQNNRYCYNIDVEGTWYKLFPNKDECDLSKRFTTSELLNLYRNKE